MSNWYNKIKKTAQVPGSRYMGDVLVDVQLTPQADESIEYEIAADVVRKIASVAEQKASEFAPDDPYLTVTLTPQGLHKVQ